MIVPTPLPPGIADRPFTVAEALALGISRDRLQRSDLRSPHRGVRVPAHLPDSLAVRAAAALLAAPTGAMVTGWAAVELLGLPLPLGMSAAGPGSVVPLAAPPRSTTAPRSPGLDAVHRTVLGPGIDHGGVAVLHPAHLWVAMASQTRFTDAVALADAVRRRWCSEEAMHAALTKHAGQRGVVSARRVLAAVRWPVDSPMETRSRLLLVGRGLPEPVCGYTVTHIGQWFAQLDMAWPEVKVALEFEGDHHRTDRRQWQHDIVRRRQLEALGWQFIVISARDVLKHPDEFVQLVARALRARGLAW